MPALHTRPLVRPVSLKMRLGWHVLIRFRRGGSLGSPRYSEADRWVHAPLSCSISRGKVEVPLTSRQSRDRTGFLGIRLGKPPPARGQHFTSMASQSG